MHHVLHGVVEACERERLHYNAFRRHESRCALEHLRELRFVDGTDPAMIRALLDEVERLTAERDDLLAWSQRFSDLVGVDGSTEAGRDEAFAKLYDAAKASGKLVKE
jgi:hypothetical protein